MNIQLRKKMISLMGLILIMSINVSAESNQIVRFYEVPSKTQRDRRIRFFNEQDLSDFINHIEFLSENSKAIGRPHVIRESLKIRESLEVLRDSFLVSGKFAAVELRIASTTAKVNGKTYLMPFAAELYGVITKHDFEIHKQ